MSIKPDFLNFIKQNSDDVFINHNTSFLNGEKNALIFVHTLTFGGSQSALCSLLSRLKASSYNLWIISPIDGEFRERYMQEFGANIIIHTFLMEDNYKEVLRENFDLVVLNSICSNYYAYPFINTNIPVLFWIHESTNFLKENSSILVHPAFVSDNFHYITAWPDAAEGFENLFTKKADILPIEVKDTFNGDGLSPSNSKCTFLLPGTYIEQKGFHVALQIIKNLPQSYLDNANFIFLGHIGDLSYYNQLKDSASSLSNVSFVGEVPFSEMKTYYQNCDCVIAPSFFDAGPMTVIEALMMEKLCIVSSLCGASSYITDCENGFVYPGDKPEELLKRIMLVISDYKSFSKIAEKARKTYEQFFSKKAVDQKYQALLEQYSIS